MNNAERDWRQTTLGHAVWLLVFLFGMWPPGAWTHTTHVMLDLVAFPVLVWLSWPDLVMLVRARRKA